ncbi:MAG: ABC transporter substrate-binding protein [Deltaproteobacteria bacterium]|nr:ABC transporter substrate-binding protein [Deltaproteobacteria bacterium]
MIRFGMRLWVLLLLLIGISFTPAGAAGKKVVIAHGAVSGDTLPLWIAKEQRFFDKYGVEAELVVVKGTPTVISGLISGDIHMGYTGGTGVVGPAAGGADLKIIATFFNKPILRVVARPEIEKAEDLKGKRLAVQSIGGANWMQCMLALEQLGLEPRRDNISVINTGSSPVRAQALEAGSVDFTVFSDISFASMLKQKGFRIVGEIPPINFVSVGIVVEKGFLQRSGGVVENAMKALSEAVAFALSPERKAATIELMTRRLNLRSEAAEERYKELTKIMERKPYTSLEGMHNIQRLMKLHNPQVAKIDVQSLIDNHFIQKLDQSGFLERLRAVYGPK